MSRVPSNDELQKYTRHELISFLKSRGVGHTGGNRQQLVSLAKLYASRPEVISDPEVTFKSDNSLPNDSVTKWQNAATEQPAIPSGLTLETITSYLREVPTLFVHNEEEHEEIDVGTEKPVVKGRQMYQSGRL